MGVEIGNLAGKNWPTAHGERPRPWAVPASHGRAESPETPAPPTKWPTAFSGKTLASGLADWPDRTATQSQGTTPWPAPPQFADEVEDTARATPTQWPVSNDAGVAMTPWLGGEASRVQPWASPEPGAGFAGGPMIDAGGPDQFAPHSEPRPIATYDPFAR